jgi:Fe(3+) dicitrate transport protein
MELKALAAVIAAVAALPAASQEAPANKGVIETVTIIGTRDEVRGVAGSGAVITAEDIARFQDTDIQRILSQVPGVYFREEEGYGLRPNISIRGSYGDRSSKITLMEDGVLIAPAPYTASSAYYFPTTGRIAGVEVLKGAAATENGPYTIGGAINLLSTPIPEATSGQVLAEGGKDSTYRLHANYGGSTERWGFLLEGHTWGSDGFSSIDNAGDDTGFEKNDLLAKLRYNSGSDADIYQQIELKLQYSDEDSDQTYVGLTEADFGDDPNRRYGMTRMDNMDNEHKSVNLTHAIEFTDAVKVTTTGYYNEFTRDWYKVDKIDGEGIDEVITCANGGSCDGLSSAYGSYDPVFAIAVLDGEALSDVYVKHNNRDYESKGLQSRLRWNFSTASLDHALHFGARYHEDFEERRQPVDQFLQGDDGSFELTEPGTASRSKRDSDAWSAYLTDELSVGTWTFKPGIRYEDYSINGVDNDETLLGLGTTWAVSESVQLLAGVYEGHSPSSSADSDPETATNYEFGGRFTRGALYAELIGFLSDYDNIIGVCTNSGGAGPLPCEAGDTENGGEAEIKGVEVTGSYALSFGNAQIPLSLAYTYTDAEFKSSFVGRSVWGAVEEGDELPNLPEHQLFFTAGLVLNNGFGADARLRYFDDTCASAACDDFEEIDAYYSLDLSAYYDWNDRTRVYLTVDNLTDEDGDIISREPKAGARGQQPRTVLAGVRFDF